MIHLFSHYVPARVVLLTALEGLLFLVASIAGFYVYLHVAGPGATSYGAADELFSGAGLFVVGIGGVFVFFLGVGGSFVQTIAEV